MPLRPSYALSVCCFFIRLIDVSDFLSADGAMLRALAKPEPALERFDFLMLLLAELLLSESESEVAKSMEWESEAWWPSVSCSLSKF